MPRIWKRSRSLAVKIALNSTPLIFLAKTDSVQLITSLFNAVIDNYVYEEVVSTGIKKGLRGAKLVKSLVDNGEVKLIELKNVEPIASSLKVGYGEISTITLVKRGYAEIAIIDDRYARNVAKAYGVKVHGTLFLLLMGVKKRVISRDEALDILADMVREGFRISPEVIAEFSRKIRSL